MTTPRTALTALTAAALLGLTACGQGVDPDPRPAQSPEQATTSASNGAATSAGTASDGGLKEILAAIDTAEQQTGGTAYDVADEDHDGSWELDVASKMESINLEVDASGSVTEQESSDLAEPDREGLEQAQIRIGPAIETALQEVDGAVHDAELTKIGGQYFWKVSIDTAATEAEDDDKQVLVDVTDGDVAVNK